MSFGFHFQSILYIGLLFKPRIKHMLYNKGGPRIFETV